MENTSIYSAISGVIVGTGGGAVEHFNGLRAENFRAVFFFLYIDIYLFAFTRNESEDFVVLFTRRVSLTKFSRRKNPTCSSVNNISKKFKVLTIFIAV